MSRKFTAARRNAFLRALEQTGNQTLSAERAKVSRSWVCLHRRNNPEFDVACREAIAVAKMMLSDDGSREPVEQRFLAVLAGTANVKLACREVGLWPPSAYSHRKRFPGFARAWDQAIEVGMLELESQIHENIGHYFDRELPEPAMPMRDVCVMDAIRLVRLYEKRERGSRRREK